MVHKTFATIKFKLFSTNYYLVIKSTEYLSYFKVLLQLLFLVPRNFFSSALRSLAWDNIKNIYKVKPKWMWCNLWNATEFPGWIVTCFHPITTMSWELKGEEGHPLCQNPGKSPFVSYCEDNNSLVVRLNAAHESPAVINQSRWHMRPSPRRT